MNTNIASMSSSKTTSADSDVGCLDTVSGTPMQSLAKEIHMTQKTKKRIRTFVLPDDLNTKNKEKTKKKKRVLTFVLGF